MKLYKATGIIIKRKNFGEADRLVTLFTSDYGKLKIIAKGVRKITSRRSGHLEIFGEANCTLFHGKTFDSVTEVTRTSRPDFPRHVLYKVSYAYYVCELVDILLPDNQPQQDIYELFCESLDLISTAESEVVCDQIIQTFSLRLLDYLGYLSLQHKQNGIGIQNYIESITERKLKTPSFLGKLL